MGVLVRVQRRDRKVAGGGMADAGEPERACCLHPYCRSKSIRPSSNGEGSRLITGQQRFDSSRADTCAHRPMVRTHGRLPWYEGSSPSVRTRVIVWGRLPALEAESSGFDSHHSDRLIPPSRLFALLRNSGREAGVEEPSSSLSEITALWFGSGSRGSGFGR